MSKLHHIEPNAAAVQHLAEMARLYGYDLTPVKAPVIEMRPTEATMQSLLKKKNWTGTDWRAAVKYCKARRIGTNIPGLLETLIV